MRTIVTSSGLDTTADNSTPLGEFLFHSVVMDQNQHIHDSESQKLGSKASHGCLRLPLADAKWIYDHIQTGTKVSIQE